MTTWHIKVQECYPQNIYSFVQPSFWSVWAESGFAGKLRKERFHILSCVLENEEPSFIKTHVCLWLKLLKFKCLVNFFCCLFLVGFLPLFLLVETWMPEELLFILGCCILALRPCSYVSLGSNGSMFLCDCEQYKLLIFFPRFSITKNKTKKPSLL